ncbi:uncharacterized protein [Rutidosis leptorrhynchoides]|uniref:uncharacterized protein n=1 Tax=Rutidosis leptorrhynchoides TaxID=125765 RepID=UPI003A99A37A
MYTTSHHSAIAENVFPDQNDAQIHETIPDECNNDEEVDEDEEEDSDFVVDEENQVDVIKVDMTEYNLHINNEVEFMVTSHNSPIIPIDNEPEDDADLVLTDNVNDSATDEDETDENVIIRARKIRELKNKQLQVEGLDHDPKTHFYLGQTFGTSREVKDLVNKIAVETRRELKIVKNDLERVRIVCLGTNIELGKSSQCDGAEKSDKCPWVLQVSKLQFGETWMVKTFNNKHKCQQSRIINQCSSVYLANEIMQQIEGNPDIPTQALKEELEKKYGVKISLRKTYYAKQKALKCIRGDYKQLYGLLRDYCGKLISKNPGTTIKIDLEHLHSATSDSRQFKRIYVYLGPLREDFRLCMRQILGLDGAFTKGQFPGQLLTAVGVDSNNGIYPLAYAIVEAENTESWKWFLLCLGADLGLVENSNFTFITYRQKGILPAIASVFPCAEHRYYVRHIHQNFKKTYRGEEYKKILWKSASATTVIEFEGAMQEMRQFNIGAYEWLCLIPPHNWSRSHFTGRAHLDLLVNNLCEVFNKELRAARDKPIITALDYVCEYLMKRIANVQSKIEKFEGPLTPAATRLFNVIKTQATQYTIVWNGGSQYQVSGPWGDQCVVDVTQRVCSCKKWELTGMPCKHVVRTIRDMADNRLNPGPEESWVHPCYWLETWKNVYSHKIKPINGRNMWEKCNATITITAPKHHTPVGRPKK